MHRALTYLVHRQNTWHDYIGHHAMRKNYHSSESCRTLRNHSEALPDPSRCSSSATLYHCTCQLMSLSRRTASNESDLCVVQPSKSGIPNGRPCSIQLLPVFSLKKSNIQQMLYITTVTVLSNRCKLLAITRTFKSYDDTSYLYFTGTQRRPKRIMQVSFDTVHHYRLCAHSAVTVESRH